VAEAVLAHRPEFERATPALPADLAVERPLGLAERVWGLGWVRKLALLAGMAAAWEVAARIQASPLMLPTFGATALALAEAVAREGLLDRAATSLEVLLKGYAIGVALAFVLTAAAVGSRLGRDLLSLLTGMLNPLPAIACCRWPCSGSGSARPASCSSWSTRSCGRPRWRRSRASRRARDLADDGPQLRARRAALRLQILVPAALPAILSGLEIAWAFAWRTLIAAELVFGVSSGQGGLGWYIFQNRNELLTDKVFAGLATVILIGLAVENLVFRPVERATVRRWGMVR
jgi:NitT/TauT family transport system permease protein